MYRTDLIREAMEREGVSIAALAGLAEVSRPTIYAALEGKRVELNTLEAIARALKIPMWELFREVGGPIQTEAATA